MSESLDHLVVAASERIRIRRKHGRDALNDFRWRRDPEIARYDAALPLAKTFSDFLDQFERDLVFGDPSRRMFALEEPGGAHIGNIMYYNGDRVSQTVEVGICIALEEYRGAGLGTEAVVSFLRYLWEVHPFRLAYLHTLEWNVRARRCFEKAGFSPTARVLRQRQWLVRMEARREWWLMWDQEGRFDAHLAPPTDGTESGSLATPGARN